MSNIFSDQDSEESDNASSEDVCTDTENDGDMTETFNEVDKSFIIKDARKSLGPLYNYSTVIGETSESEDDDVEDSRDRLSVEEDIQKRISDSEASPVKPKNRFYSQPLCISSDDDDNETDNGSDGRKSSPSVADISVADSGKSDSEILSTDPKTLEKAVSPTDMLNKVISKGTIDTSVILISSDDDEDSIIAGSPVVPFKGRLLKTRNPVANGKPAAVVLPETVSQNEQQTQKIVPPSYGLPTVQTLSPTVPVDYHTALAMNRVQALRAQVAEKRNQYTQIKTAIKTIATSQLPDGGARLEKRLHLLTGDIHDLETELAKAISSPPGSGDAPLTLSGGKISASSAPEWTAYRNPAHNLQAAGTKEKQTMPQAANWNTVRNTADIQHGFGPKAMEHHLAEKSITLDALRALHKSLETRPLETELAENPQLLRSETNLMPHQKKALKWLTWREKQQHPSGGILADDMGLGKTLTMIALMLKHSEENKEPDESSSDEEDDDTWKGAKSGKRKAKSVRGGTLVVCPASLLSQWEGEVKKRVKSNRISVEVHHGCNRERRGYRLARLDMVITTYSIVRTERQGRGALHQVKWQRVILDEAHVVRNHKSQTSVAVCELHAKYRWCLTGTPVHNKELDLFALVKFMRCTPFDDLAVWKRWIDNKNNSGTERLNLMLSGLLLRRTKAQLQEANELGGLTTKELHEIDVALTKQETAVYEKILAFSKSMFATFLQQRYEREAMQRGVVDYTPLDLKKLDNTEFNPNTKLGAMVNKYSEMSDIKSHVILVLLLRLRQICVHPTLVSSMLEDSAGLEESIDEEEAVDNDLAGALGKMKISPAADRSSDSHNFEEDKIWNRDNPVFDPDSISSKIKAIVSVLEKNVLGTDDKAVVVSQWVTMLDLLENVLKEKSVSFVKLCGATKVRDRMEMVDTFNKPGRAPKVMLLSLTAGGVGLNLIGANHLFLCDLHWNPQLEAQACDRVFRVGQIKPVHIYKFICKDTIEENIQALQLKKMAIATDVLTGARSEAQKLSMDDLKMLFDM